MWGTNSRQVFKQTLSLTKVKILYARITLTRVTTLYFGFTVVTCIILSALQGVTFTDNKRAITEIGSLLASRRSGAGIVVLQGRTLRLCDSIPDQRGTKCSDILTFGSTFNNFKAIEARSVEALISAESGAFPVARNTAFDTLAARADVDSDDDDSDGEESDDDDLDSLDGEDSDDDDLDSIDGEDSDDDDINQSVEAEAKVEATAAPTSTTVAETKVRTTTTTESRSVETTTAASTTTESKPAETTTAASTTTESKSVETSVQASATTASKPVDTTLIATSTIVSKPAEPTVAASTAEERNPKATKTQENTPAETKAAEDGKAGRDQSNDGKAKKDKDDDDKDESDDEDDDDDDDDRKGNGGEVTKADGKVSLPLALENNVDGTVASSLNEQCIMSLRWLDDTIHDAQREDVVTFAFQLWLFILAFVTILNESIPHLIAGLLGHILGTAWSGYRIESVKILKAFYQTEIVPQACNGQDLMGNWWDVRILHAIPVAVMNAVALVGLCALSYKLFSIYARESFSRVGASAKIHRMYKIVLLFSVCLQLAGFFSIASTGMWIDKICHGTMMQLAHHSKAYLAAFIITLVLSFPWFYLGWVCVRKECKIRFGIFVAISLFLLVISTVMFTSPLYVYNFISWRLFGVMSVTAYVLIVVTTILAILCRLNFGKGLAHYLQVSDALEGMDFTPVVFVNTGNTDLEKNAALDEKFGPATFMGPTTVTIPPTACHTAPPKKHRGSSIYSEQNGTAMYLSSSPPLVSEIAPAPNRLSRAASKRSVVPYPSLRDIDGQRAEARRSKVQAVPRVPSARGSAQSAYSTRSISPVSFQEGASRKTGLPANPRSSRGPSRFF